MDEARRVQEMALSQGEERWWAPLSELSLAAPLPRPESVRDAMAFEDHIINCIRTVGLGPLGPVDEKIEKRWGRKKKLGKIH